ncbi:hypothetical protein DPMN_176743 [Dreissena polymorpha]|uniref:Uncharacterized protein n=1 Tax=Dreissena polymorpha TaxID=45954 RepID=A0A9D4IJW8_DREPO|nr:hypothetical protein DPMN_176743 [Dreissena polymorpha]
MTQDDLEIQILLWRFTLLRGETTLADATCSEILMKLKSAIENKKHELAQRQANYG